MKSRNYKQRLYARLLDILPVGREFGSKDHKGLAQLDAYITDR